MPMPGGSRRDDVTGGDGLGRSEGRVTLAYGQTRYVQVQGSVGHGLPRFKFHKFHLAVVFRFSLLPSQLRSQRINGQG